MHNKGNKMISNYSNYSTIISSNENLSLTVFDPNGSNDDAPSGVDGVYIITPGTTVGVSDAQTAALNKCKQNLKLAAGAAIVTVVAVGTIATSVLEYMNREDDDSWLMDWISDNPYTFGSAVGTPILASAIMATGQVDNVIAAGTKMAKAGAKVVQISGRAIQSVGNSDPSMLINIGKGLGSVAVKVPIAVINGGYQLSKTTVGLTFNLTKTLGGATLQLGGATLQYGIEPLLSHVFVPLTTKMAQQSIALITEPVVDNERALFDAFNGPAHLEVAVAEVPQAVDEAQANPMTPMGLIERTPPQQPRIRLKRGLVAVANQAMESCVKGPGKAVGQGAAVVAGLFEGIHLFAKKNSTVTGALVWSSVAAWILLSQKSYL